MQYKFAGEIIRGAGYGRKLGFPTLNIAYDEFLKLDKQPRFGVYAGIVKLEDETYKAGIVVGPEDENGLPKLEAHLLGYSGDAYGKRAEYVLNEFIRSYKNFDNEADLIIQIKKDIEYVREK